MDDERMSDEKMERELGLIFGAKYAKKLVKLRTLETLLAGAVPLLELAAVLVGKLMCEHCPARDGCPAFDGGARDTWPCHTAPAQLRELALALALALGR